MIKIDHQILNHPDQTLTSVG